MSLFAAHMALQRLHIMVMRSRQALHAGAAARQHAGVFTGVSQVVSMLLEASFLAAERGALPCTSAFSVIWHAQWHQTTTSCSSCLAWLNQHPLQLKSSQGTCTWLSSRHPAAATLAGLCQAIYSGAVFHQT